MSVSTTSRDFSRLLDEGYNEIRVIEATLPTDGLKIGHSFARFSPILPVLQFDIAGT